MNSDVDICWSRTVLCALQTGGKYFAELVKNRCENTAQKSFRNVLNENFYKHDILHLWRNDKCCMCGIKKRPSVHTLSQDQIKLIYSITDEKCGGTAPCKVCPKSYNAKDGVCTSQLDITFSHALLKGIFLKFVQNKPDLEKVRDAVDEIKDIRNILVHSARDPLNGINLDEKWLKLKENLTVICDFLKEPIEKLEEEMEKYHYIVNDCSGCSAVMTRLLDGEEVLYGRIDVCSECAKLQQALPDAKDVIFHNLHLFWGIAPHEFLPELYEANVITSDEIDKIYSKKIRREQMIEFLSILKTKGLGSCRMTLDILSAMDYGPKIRDMRKKRVSDCRITLSGNEDPIGAEGNSVYNGEEKATITISILSSEKDICERELIETINCHESVSELKNMGPKDFSIGKGSVTVTLTFECKEDYNKFCDEIKEGNVYDYLSRLWEKTMDKEIITDKEANMVVHIQYWNGSSRVEENRASSGDFADSFIDENYDFLIEEMSPGTLINYLKMEGHQIDDVLKTRKENPFDRRSQAKKLLDFFRKTPLSFFRDCMFATQTDIIKDKVNDFYLSVGENSFAEDSWACREAFEVTPEGTKFSLKGDDEISLEFEENSVQKTTEMKFELWPLHEERFSRAKTRGDLQFINAISDSFALEYDELDLTKRVHITLPLYGTQGIESGDNLLSYSIDKDFSNIRLTKLTKDLYTTSKGAVKVKQEIPTGKRFGIIKTKSEDVRMHELFEIFNGGYLGQVLYFKASRGTESGFDLWIECTKLEDVENTVQKHIKSKMIEFPMSRSDTIPLYDGDTILIDISGSVSIKGERRRNPPPIYIVFRHEFKTAHAKIPLVKREMIHKQQYVKVTISFRNARGRQPIIQQLDPWGGKMRPNPRPKKVE